MIPDMGKSYNFDGLLPPETCQKGTYSGCCEGMLDSFLRGFNCCVLAYGQTGSGKSYTMGTTQQQSSGDHRRTEDRGIIPRALTDVSLRNVCRLSISSCSLKSETVKIPTSRFQLALSKFIMRVNK